MNTITYENLPTPCWLLDVRRLEENMKLFSFIKEHCGVKILLALKGYALWKSFPFIVPHLDGCCASGLHEAKLASEMFKKEVHTYAPAFKESELEEIALRSNHLVFNTPSQFKRFSSKVKKHNPKLSLGLRINPEYSEAPTQSYNPCEVYSRLGTTLKNFDESILPLCEGLHFHALCEESAEALENVLKHFEEKFAPYIYKMKWINFGGGHHITRKGYDIEKLICIIKDWKSKYDVEIYLEPGEAIGWQTGTLVSSVLELMHNEIDIAILDTSAEAHMPDTLLMPYRADVESSGKAQEKAYTYRLTGNTCLAGDVMGDYSFDEPLKLGSKVVFLDQMHYTMVKATTFNGIKLPNIALRHTNGDIEVVRTFGYESFKDRLS